MSVTSDGVAQPSNADIESFTITEKEGVGNDFIINIAEKMHLEQSAVMLKGVAKVIQLLHSSGDYLCIGLMLDPIGLGLVFWLFGGVTACICWMFCLALGTAFKGSGCDYSCIGSTLGPIGCGLVFWTLRFFVTCMDSTVYVTLLRAIKDSGHDYSYIAQELDKIGLAFGFWLLSGIVAYIGPVVYRKLVTPFHINGGECPSFSFALGPMGLVFWLLSGIVACIGSIALVMLVASFDNAGSCYWYNNLKMGPIGLWLVFWLLGGVVVSLGLRVSVKLNSMLKHSGGEYSYIVLVLGQIGFGVGLYLLGGIGVSIASIAYLMLGTTFKNCDRYSTCISLAIGPVGTGLVFWLLAGIVACIGRTVHETQCRAFKMVCDNVWCGVPLGALFRAVGQEIGHLIKMYYLRTFKWIVRPLTNAIMALTFANYILKPFFPGCQPLLAVTLLAAIILVLLTAVSSVNVNWKARLLGVATRRTLLALLIIALSYQFQGQATTRSTRPVVTPAVSSAPVPVSAAALSTPGSKMLALPSKAEHPLLRDNAVFVTSATYHLTSRDF